MYDAAGTIADIYAFFAAKEGADPSSINKAETALIKSLVLIGGPAALDELRRQQAERVELW